MDNKVSVTRELGSPFSEIMEQSKVTKFTKVKIEDGATITKPQTMPWNDAIRWMEQARDDEKKVVTVSREFNRVPWEVGVCLRRVIEDMFGFMNEGSAKKFQYIDVATSYSTKEKGILGEFSLPGIDGVIIHHTQFQIDNGRFVLRSVLTAEIKKGSAEKFNMLLDALESELKTGSIYKGKAFNDKMLFMDLTNAHPENLLFDETEMEQIKASIWTAIQKTDQVKRAGIPIKRGVLLHGPYGCGKTQTAYCTAKIAEENGFTFILTNANNFVGAFKLATVYAPAVVFVEDLDEIMSGTERTVEVNNILNTVDGVEGKDKDVLVIYTTNHIEKLNRAMLRPGRLDALVHLKPPSPETVLKFFEMYGKGMLPPVEQLTAAAKVCNGMIPAMIREVVERSKLYALSRGTGSITPKDVELAARQLDDHRRLLEGDVKGAGRTVRLLAEINHGQMKHLGETLVASIADGDVETDSL